MRIVQHGRRGGKTTEVVTAWRARGTPARLIVATAPERSRIIAHYQLTPDEASRVDVARAGILKGIQAETFCDNLDWVASMFLGGWVDVATVNGPENAS